MSYAPFPFLMLRIPASSVRKPIARSPTAISTVLITLHAFSFQGRKTTRSANVFLA